MDYYYANHSPKIRSLGFKKITELVKELCPNNSDSVIYGYLFHSNFGKPILKHIKSTVENKYTQIPNVMKEYLDGLSKKEFEKVKDIFITILCESNFPKEEVIDLLDITVSSNKWRRIRNKEPLKIRGNKSLDNNLSNRIKEWCEMIDDDDVIRKTVQTVTRTKKKEISYIKENKLAVVCCFTCLYKQFIQDISNQEYSSISYSSFYRRIPKNVIIPVKKTDLCELCLKAKKLESKIIQTNDEKNLILLYKNHLYNAKNQRNSLKLNLQNLKSDKAILIMDFKQNIKLGNSPQQVSYDYFHPTSINYLSFFVKTIKESIFFDFTSMELNKDSYFVIECFKLMFEHEIFKKMGINELDIWSDVGKHFKSGILAYYLANLIVSKKIKVTHNFFVESHGKSICDVHFSQVIR